MAIVKEGNEFYPLVEDRDTILEQGKMETFSRLNNVRLAHERSLARLHAYGNVMTIGMVAQEMLTRIELQRERNKAQAILEVVFSFDQ